MQYRIVHSLPARIRLKLKIPFKIRNKLIPIDQIFLGLKGLQRIDYNPKTQSLVIYHNDDNCLREKIYSTLSELTEKEMIDLAEKPIKAKLVEAEDRYEKKQKALVSRILLLVMRRFIPAPIRGLLFIRQLVKDLKKGIEPLLEGKLNSDVLDASGILVAVLMKEYGTAQTISILLQVGDFLEEWTRQRSRQNLSQLINLHDDEAWVLRNGEELKVPLSRVLKDELVVYRQGSQITFDGIVKKGNVLVNQSSLTGETLPVHKRENDEVFAGTTVTEGTVIISVQKLQSETRISQIVKTIEESESLKAGIQNHAERLSDRLVPYSFLISGLTWLVTGNPRKAASTLLVDYSCSLKLATPLTIMSAMISASRNGVLIKGGKYIEALSKADTYVLDKTGTLTEARPEILDVIPFNGFKRDFLLKSAAGVEERFTHPVASAVVDKAKQEGLEFSCSYTDAEYIVAHGVKSTVEGNSFLVGSRHFLEDDNAIDFTPYSDTIRDLQDKGLSSLYIAFKSELAGVITFTDPIRNDAKDFISGSKQLGVKKHIMLTGDQLNSAARVAENLMIEQFRAEVFPEEKAEIVSELQSQGSVVAMIGDGMNDSPALALADIGISLKQGADIAKETCNILLLNSDLQSINHTKVLSKKAITRIQTNFYCIIGINSVLIGLGLIGKIQPAASAFLHNASTIAVSLNALRRI